MVTDEKDSSTILPNSYQSSQFQSITQSNKNGTSEQIIQTETRRTIETTMRMEHKSPHPDIQLELKESFTPSPNNFESTENYQLKTKTLFNGHLTPQLTQNNIEHNESKYSTFNTLSNGIQQNDISNENPQVNCVDFATNHTDRIDSEPKNFKSVTDHIKNIENSHLNEQTPELLLNGPYQKFKLDETTNLHEIDAFSRFNGVQQSKPYLVLDSNSQNYQNATTNTYEQDSIEKTIQNKLYKIDESETFKYQSKHDYNLKAPALVKTTTEELDALNLEPGEPPKMCYALRQPADNKKELHFEETVKNLNKNLEREPSKVLPHSVRTIPPQSTENITMKSFKAPKCSILKDKKTYDNHISQSQNPTFIPFDKIYCKNSEQIQSTDTKTENRYNDASIQVSEKV